MKFLSLGTCGWAALALLWAFGPAGTAEPAPGQEEPKTEPRAEHVPAPEAAAEEARKAQQAEAAANAAYGKAVAAGRAAFGKRNYAEALAHFREAAELMPENRYAALLAGVAAYWNREPRVALDYWAPLAEKAPQNSPEEWEATRHLVLAWHALNEDAKAEQCVRRLYDLRSRARLKPALAANGFTRQHLWLGTRRMGVWEVFDERGERPSVWEFTLVETKDGDDQDLTRLIVEPELQADGRVGYALVEPGSVKRVYKRWLVKPAYVDARNTAVAAAKGQLKYIDASPIVGEDAPVAVGPAPTQAEPAVPPQKPGPAARDAAELEKARLQKIEQLKLSPVATRLLSFVARLAGIDFDISRYVRLSLTDPASARKFEKAGLTDRWPQATTEASDLVQFVATIKPTDLQEAFRHLPVALAGTKGDYARFVLLTALNTRGGDMPDEFLSSCLGSEDFVVRETAALLMARSGRKEGLEALFKELAATGDGKAGDEAARIISFPLEELLGPVLGPCPMRDTAGWREAALAWWKQHEAKLGYLKGAPAGQAVWRPVP